MAVSRGAFDLHQGPDLAERISQLQDEVADAFTLYNRVKAKIAALDKAGVLAWLEYPALRGSAARHLRRALGLNRQIKRLQQERE